MGSKKARHEARAALLTPAGIDLGLRPEPARRGSRTRRTQVAGISRVDGDPTVSARLLEALRASGEVARATHGFHTYPAGLHPDAARLLLELAPGPVLDPFCGGGTVLVEAMLAGRDALGLDVSAVALLVARARTARTTEAERTALRTLARQATAAARTRVFQGEPPPAVPPAIAHAYEPQALVELAALADAIGRDEAARAVFSSILVKASRRAGDTRNETVDRARPAGTTATLFHARAREYGRMLEELAALAPPGARVRVHREDAREVRLRDRFGLILTSPPYPGVYDYVALQALRHFWLGIDDTKAEGEEIGSRRSFRFDPAEGARRWREDTARWLRTTSRALLPGGRVVVVVGDGRVGRKPVNSLAAMDEAARAAGLRRLGSATVERYDPGIDVAHLEHAIAWERGGETSPSPERLG